MSEERAWFAFVLLLHSVASIVVAIFAKEIMQAMGVWSSILFFYLIFTTLMLIFTNLEE